jgi:hypothetical protein
MRTTRLLPALLVPLLVACQGGRPDTTGLSSDGFPAPDKGMVYAAAIDALRQQGFTADSSASSDVQGVVTTRYKLNLAPFSGQGYREKATVRIKDLPNHPSHYTVEVNVLREINKNITQPSNPVAAEWASPERVQDIENLIKSRIEMRFIASDASDAFRRERGLAPSQTGRVSGTGQQPAYSDPLPR